MATKVALIQKRPVGGRMAQYERAALSLRDLVRGDRVSLPLPSGEQEEGVVNLAVVDPSGQVRIAGSLAGGGSFSLSEAADAWVGRIILRERELAYVLSTVEGGRLQMEERWLGELICLNLPRAPEETTVPTPSQPLGAPPEMSSRPGASAVLYLDFDGETVQDPDWNEGNAINAAPSNLNSSQIEEVWRRVSEDYSPFNIDVTTSLSRYQNAPVGRRMRVIITPTSEWNGGGGGIAYLDSFSRAGSPGWSSDMPAFVFNASVTGVAEAVTHELGHTLGLRHDGRSSPAEDYYKGDSTWAPIMGESYYAALTQWSKGEYADANNTEDDIAIIAGLAPTAETKAINNVGFAADTAGNARETAATLTFSSGAIAQHGVIETSEDIDYFVFTVPASTVAVTAKPASHGPNVDTFLELRDSGGNLLASANPEAQLTAFISHQVVAGTYYLSVRGTGRGNPASGGYSAYGSIGQFTLEGSVFVMAPPVITSATTLSAGVGEPISYAIVASNSPTSFQASNLPAGLSLNPSSGVITGVVTTAGSYAITIGATNPAGSVTANLQLTVVAGAPVIVSQPQGHFNVERGGTLNLSVGTFSASGAATYQWRRNGVPIPGATGSTLSITDARLKDTGSYYVTVTNTSGLRHSVPFFVNVTGGESQFVGWGWGNSGQLSVPASVTDGRALVAGTDHVFMLRGNGLLQSWGGYTEVPASVSNAVTIDAGYRINASVRSGGTVVETNTFGRGIMGELSGVVAVAAGTRHSIALKTDGTVWAWGLGSTASWTAPAGLNRVVAIAVADDYSLALRDDGTVVAWGFSFYGQTMVPASVANVIAISAGGRHAMALKADGSVVEWGSPAAVTPAAQTLGNVVEIAAGNEHSLALRADGTVVAWGFSGNGETTVPAGATNVFAISAGSAFSVALRDASPPPLPPRPPTFAAEVYLSRYPTVAALFAGLPDRLDRAWRHYLQTGLGLGFTDGDFDVAAYVAQYPQVAEQFPNDLPGAAVHWYTTGRSLGHRIPTGFDVQSYLTRNPAHATRFANDLYGAWLYYRDVGVYDGEVYDDLFRPEEYLALYPELLAALGPDLKEALLHWLGQGRIEGRLGRIPLEFDSAGYFERNPDVAAAVGHNLILGWQHFWNYGIYEGRAYDEEFRVFEYLALNQDLQAAFLEDWRGATLHWLRYGRTEGRLGRVPLIFDVDFYLGQYPDVESVFGRYPSTVFQHYYFFGVYEARIFDNEFRVDEYIALNPDLQTVFGTDRRGAFMHWVRWGRSEGRVGRAP